MAIRHDDHPTERVERVERERIEHVHDSPAVAGPATSNVNVGRGTTHAPVWTVTSVVTLIFTVL